MLLGGPGGALPAADFEPLALISLRAVALAWPCASSYTSDMVRGVWWYWMLGVFAFTVAWYVCAVPLITDGLVVDIHRASLPDIRTVGFALRFVGTFVLAMSPPVVAIGEVVRQCCVPLTSRA